MEAKTRKQRFAKTVSYTKKWDCERKNTWVGAMRLSEPIAITPVFFQDGKWGRLGIRDISSGRRKDDKHWCIERITKMKVLVLSDLNFLSKDHLPREDRGGGTQGSGTWLQSNTGCPVEVGQHDFVVGHVNGVIWSSPEHSESQGHHL